MKRGLKIMIIAGLAGFVLWGCSNSGGSSNNTTAAGQYCDIYGNCYSLSGSATGSDYLGLGANAVILYTNGPINISNGAQYDAFLRSVGACNNSINSCYGYDGPPAIKIELDDYTYPTSGTTTGNVTMYVPAGAFNANVYFHPINANAGFTTTIQTSPSLTGWGSVSGTGGLLQIIVNGLDTDAAPKFQLVYNNNVIGTGTFYRESR